MPWKTSSSPPQNTALGRPIPMAHRRAVARMHLVGSPIVGHLHRREPDAAQITEEDREAADRPRRYRRPEGLEAGPWDPLPGLSL